MFKKHLKKLNWVLSSHYILWWRLGTLHPIPSLQNPTSGSNSTASGWLSVSFQAFMFFFPPAGGLVLSHVSAFPFGRGCRCKGAELLGIQRALVAVGHSIFQCEERIARHSRCVPALALRPYPEPYSCGMLSIPGVCFRCFKAVTEHLGAYQGESLSGFTSASPARGEACGHPLRSLP